MLNTFEQFLSDYQIDSTGSVSEAFHYATADGGKRIRPMLLLALLSDYNVDLTKGLSSALAIEFIHSYSLVHDDLPAMDNDDYRRGKLSVHKKYGEDIAILAGDALLTEAFAVLANDQENDAAVNLKLIQYLSKCAGINGMIYGQQLDLAAENHVLDEAAIHEINRYKTSKLLIFAMVAPAIISGHNDHIKILEDIALKLGLAFQIQDDILDVTKSFEEIGKVGSDESNHKSTLVNLLGLDNATTHVEHLFNDIYSLVKQLNLSSNHVITLINSIEKRQK